MAIDIDRLGLTPDFEPNPWFAVGLIRVDGGEIVGAVFFDHYPSEGGSIVDADGVVDPDEAISEPDAGWFLQVLSEGMPNVKDPRVMAPMIDYIGAGDVSLDDAFTAGLEAVAQRGQILGLSDEQARRRLLWSPRRVDDGAHQDAASSSRWSARRSSASSR